MASTTTGLWWDSDDTIPPAREPVEWKMSRELSAECLRTFDPLPLLLRELIEIQGLHRHHERLFTIVAELFNKALDHGLPGLDSRRLRACSPRDGRSAEHHQASRPSLDENVGHSGRAMPLLRKLCSELTSEGTGKCVKAVFTWQ